MTTAAGEHPAVLCVDDEPHVLEGLGRHLRRHFRVTTASSGAAGLEAVAQRGPFAVVVSDMRMPEMDGATFLRRVRETAPDTTRVLLTGHADLTATITAVNEANVFRFLCKPCTPDVLTKALEAGAEQYRLVTAERVLLQETLHGSIKMLIEVLSLANPLAFGRATRAKQLVSRVLAHLGMTDGWAVEVAAMLSQVGCVTLPPATAEKLYHGRALEHDEQRMADRLPALTARLLGNIPRLEPVREILLDQGKHVDVVPRARIAWGARLLKIVLDWDALEAQGLSTELALQTIRGRRGWYDPELLGVVATVLGASADAAEVREMSLRDVQPGMVFAEDVVSRTGMLLIARGQEVTESLVERIRNFSSHVGAREPVRVIVAPAPAEDAPAAVREA